MEDFAEHIELDPEPRSATLARRWMRDVLDQIDRPELAESASVAVSELVTNSILHAQTTISLVVQTFGKRVVVTVTDRSPVPSRARISSDASPDDETTVGRGLRIVRACAVDWGITSSPHGKAIWFVPSDAPHSVDPASFPGMDLLGDEEQDEVVIEGPRVLVRMVDAPVVVLRHFHDKWNELLREMQLIALGEPSELQGLAQELIGLVAITRSTRWMTPDSVGALVESTVSGADRIDLELDIPTAARPAFARQLEIARILDEATYQDLLLYLPGGGQAEQLREWWFGGIARQLGGEPPQPWSSGFALDTAELSC
ncbi:MAG TPA: ATP-binding protein [Nocardioidaceae bacterium]|nr:ATP-binding protein [Nocardioidaceae bacterium]